MHNSKMMGGNLTSSKTISSCRAFVISSIAFASIFSLFLFIRPAAAATCTFASNGDSDFNTAGNWDCGHVPTSGDDVVIPAATSTSLSASVSFSALSLSGSLNDVTFDLEATSTITVAGTGVFNIGSGTATSTGDLTNSGTVDNDTGTLSVMADFLNLGTYDADFGTFRIAGGGDQDITDGAGPIFNNLESHKTAGTATIVGGEAGISGTLTTSGGGTLSVAAVGLNVSGLTTVGTGTTVTSTAGNLLFNGNVTSSGSIGSNSGAITVNGTYQNNGTLNVGSGTATVASTLTNSASGVINNDTGTLKVWGDFVNTGTYNSGVGTFQVDQGSPQSITGSAFYNLLVSKKSGSVATIVTSNATVAGTLILTTFNTLSSGAFNLTVTGATTIGASNTVTSTTGVISLGGAVTNNGNLGSISGDMLFGSTLENNGTLDIGSGTATTTGDLTNDGAGTINNNSGILSVVAAWNNTNNGIFNKGSGLTRFVGAGAQTIPTVIFNNLSFYTTGGAATLSGNATATGATLVNAGTTLAVGTSDFTAVGSITNTGLVTINVAGGGSIIHANEDHRFTDSASVTVTTVTVGGRFYVTLQDANLNLDGTTIETVTVTVSGSDSETLTLTETGVATGIFRNTAGMEIIQSFSNTEGNGRIEISADTTLTSTYTDPYDGTETDLATVSASATAAASPTPSSSGGKGAQSSGIPTPIQTFQEFIPDAEWTLSVPKHTLVKLPCSGFPGLNDPCKAVYYVGSDGNRHAFPNEKVYFTWYVSFDGVQLVDETQMAAMPLGANVTYKPGVKMVKFTTDPKVYAVEKGGILRWIKTEALAIELYGTGWNMKIDDISDAFYNNYSFGSDINTAADYSPAAAEASVVFPSDSLAS
jgi:hypothetical protein